MHELSIALSLLEQVQDLARQNRAERVSRIELEVGILAQVEPEALSSAFELAAEGTVAQGCDLAIVMKPATLECRDCGQSFEGDGRNFACPKCHTASVSVKEGRDLILKSLSLELPEGVSK